jgi:putative nucleotidyltransferase with HDIG domain
MAWPFPHFGARPVGKAILATDESDALAVLASRSSADLPILREQVLRTDAKMADLLLDLVRETAVARSDEPRLLAVVADFAFRAFPAATHHVLVVRDDRDGELTPLITRSRSGDEPEVALSRTIVSRVMDEGVTLLFSRRQASLVAVKSVALAKLQTAICAPLLGVGRTFGVLQLDIRGGGTGVFTREDADLLTVFAHQVSLALDHLRLFQQQRRALQSTINALVHSLDLKDRQTAEHSERVQAVALEIGRELGLSDTELEVLSVAAILHDLGKQGIRDEVLFKPDRLTPQEREEVARHAADTQDILDKIEYPDHLRDVPRIAAYHHEKLDGRGPFGIKGDDIPLESRIISVADVFDALMSPRVYKQPLPVEKVMGILNQGKDVDWDPLVLKALRHVVPRLVSTVYASLAAPAAAPEVEKRDDVDKAA